MKYLKVALFILFFQNTFAQVKPSDLYGTWIAGNLSFKDGTELPDAHVLKYSFFKYTFAQPNDVAFSTAYYETGSPNTFELNNGVLSIKSPQGFTMNSFKINIVNDTLLMLQRGRDGFDDPDCILFKLVHEKNYQKALALTPANIFAIKNGDTVYAQSKKVYAKYTGPSFQGFMYEGIRKKISMDGRAGHLIAAFTVSKEGVADTPKIVSGVNEKFNARFLKVFTEAKDYWLPGYINDKPVAVRMMVDLHYMSGMDVTNAILLEQTADAAYNNKEYETALFYYDQSLDKNPESKTALFRRGMCKMLLGNLKAACADWAKAIQLGSNTQCETAIAKYCQ